MTERIPKPAKLPKFQTITRTADNKILETGEDATNEKVAEYRKYEPGYCIYWPGSRVVDPSLAYVDVVKDGGTFINLVPVKDQNAYGKITAILRAEVSKMQDLGGGQVRGDVWPISQATLDEVLKILKEADSK